MFAYYLREFIPGNDPTLGVTHASESPLFFGSPPLFPSIEEEFSNQLKDFWINFVSDLKPGGGWPQYDNRSKNVMQLKRDNITHIPDGEAVLRSDRKRTRELIVCAKIGTPRRLTSVIPNECSTNSKNKDLRRFEMPLGR
ncbi:hypothetical protein AN958_00148 [Leucoagaricus sp. SymC.cos]|nr:hypothetical protein AN958_00148 [Leucoagaricus sp. SymC.cos]